MKEGWLCPRCGKINAPFVGSCDCRREPTEDSDENESTPCTHQWKLSGIDTEKTTYICEKCHSIKHIELPRKKVD